MILSEAARGLRAAPVLLWLVGAVVAGAIVVGAATAGQAAVAEAQVSAELRSPSSKVAVLTSPVDTQIPTDTLAVFQSRSDVVGMIAVGRAVDHRPSWQTGGGDAVPVWTVARFGELDAYLDLPDRSSNGLYLSSRLFRADEATPGLYTSTSGTERAGLGYFGVDESSLPEISQGGIITMDPMVVPTINVRKLYVIAAAPELTQTIRLPAAELFGDAASDVTATAPGALDAARDAVESELDRYSRALLVGIATGSAALIMVIVSVWSISKQRDFGRRRALGARRSDIAALATIQTLLAASLGVAVAFVICATSGAIGLLTLPGWHYLVSTAWTVVIAAGLGAAIPAAVLSFRDPVRVLRTP